MTDLPYWGEGDPPSEFVTGRRHLDREALERVVEWGVGQAAALRAGGDPQHADQLLREVLARGAAPSDLLDVYDDLLRQLSQLLKDGDVGSYASEAEELADIQEKANRLSDRERDG